MEQTANYGLNQWAAGDRIMREDFNADNAKVDQALGTVAEAVAKCGNCRIWTTTYTGTGEYGSEHPTQITFPQVPALFVTVSSQALMIASGQGNIGFVIYFNSFNSSTVFASNSLTWDGTTVSFYSSSARNQMNSGTNWVTAFYATDVE